MVGYFKGKAEEVARKLSEVSGIRFICTEMGDAIRCGANDNKLGKVYIEMIAYPDRVAMRGNIEKAGFVAEDVDLSLLKAFSEALRDELKLPEDVRIDIPSIYEPIEGIISGQLPVKYEEFLKKLEEFAKSLRRLKEISPYPRITVKRVSYKISPRAPVRRKATFRGRVIRWK